MFTDKRKRKDKKDEFKTAEATNKVFSDRIKDLAKGRKRPLRMAALAKLKLRPRARRACLIFKIAQSLFFDRWSEHNAETINSKLVVISWEAFF